MTNTLRAEAFVDNPQALRRELESQGALTFDPVPETGLFVASTMSDPELARVTGMGDKAWLRDNAHIAMGLLLARGPDDVPKAQGVGRAFLQILHQEEQTLLDAIDDPEAPRLAVRFDAATLEPDTESRVQTDSTGYAIWTPAELMRQKLLPATRDDLRILELTARYLEADKYWSRPDDGAWEEDCRLHTSSIGVAVASLDPLGRLFEERGYQCDVDITTLVRRGWETLDNNLWRYGETPPDPATGYPGRFYDVAQLLPVVAMNLFGNNLKAASAIVGRVVRALVRDEGIIRYLGDTYYAPGFTEMLKPGERTSQAVGRLELRNTLSDITRLTKTEARWKHLDALVSEDRGRQGRQKSQIHYLNRTLMHYVPDMPREPGRRPKYEGLRIPELDHKETLDGPWIPNDHTPLLWGQANTLRALAQFARTFKPKD